MNLVKRYLTHLPTYVSIYVFYLYLYHFLCYSLLLQLLLSLGEKGELSTNQHGFRREFEGRRCISFKENNITFVFAFPSGDCKFKHKYTHPGCSESHDKG